MTAKLSKGGKAPAKNRVACSIHITCSQAGEDGQMNVEMSYEGDSCLCAYLLEDAQKVINEKIEEEAVPVTTRSSRSPKVKALY